MGGRPRESSPCGKLSLWRALLLTFRRLFLLVILLFGICTPLSVDSLFFRENCVIQQHGNSIDVFLSLWEDNTAQNAQHAQHAQHAHAHAPDHMHMHMCMCVCQNQSERSLSGASLNTMRAQSGSSPALLNHELSARHRLDSRDLLLHTLVVLGAVVVVQIVGLFSPRCAAGRLVQEHLHPL